MTDYREINELQRDVERARRLAQLLLMLVEIEWTDWELTFLHSIIRQANERLEAKDKSPLSTRQIEILVGLREDSVLFENAEGFSIRSLIRGCSDMLHLLDEDQVEFIKRHTAVGTVKLRRREVRYLFVCARRALVIEPYQGWKPAPAEEAA